MNRVILDESQIHTKRVKDEFILSDPEVCTHLKDHLNIIVGQNLKVTILNESLGTALVKDISSDHIVLNIQETTKVEEPKTILLIGASRPPTIKKVLEHGTSFGVKEFIFFQAELSEKSYLTSKVFEAEKTYELLTKGLSQGASHAHLPKVTIIQGLSEAITYVKAQCQQNFLLSLEGSATLIKQKVSLHENHCLSLGPERGWSTKEELLIKEEGFMPIKVGATTLRVEIATFSALGQLAMIGLNR